MRSLYPWSRSILVRTAYTLSAAALLTGAVFIAMASEAIAERFHRQVDARLGELLDTVERTVSIAGYLNDRPLAIEVAQGLMKNAEVASVVIRGADNNELARLSRTMEVLEDASSELAAMHRSVVSPFDAQRVVGEIVLQPNSLEIARQIDLNVDFARYLLLIELAVLSVVVCGVVLLTVTRPIKQVSDRLHSMDAPAGDRLMPPPGHGNDEIGRLVADVNTLAGHLVTALRQEQAIRLQREAGEAKYHAIFDNAEAGIFTCGINGRVISHNPAFARLTGMGSVSAGEADGPWLSELRCHDPGRIMQALAKCIESGATVAEDIEWLGLDGSDRWLHLILNRIGPGLAQGVISDITELATARQVAEAASLAKTAFLSSMSHELRTPLNAVIGFAQLLEMGQLSEQQQEAVGYILSAGRQLLELINEVLDLARIESGRLDLCMENVALDSLLEDVLTLLTPMATQRDVVLRTSGGAGMSVHADAVRLRQILLNLLSNAVKYNREGGMASVACWERGGFVRITVTDTGMGIAELRQSEIFQPFQRLGAERTSIEGTGIGLVICKRLVEAMAGRIGFESCEGVGSAFWIELPEAGAGRPQGGLEPERQAGYAATSADTRGGVLYVEDSPMNVSLMRHIFQHLPNIELRVASSAEEGLETLRLWRPDMILMDIGLPGMSGLEALKAIQADPDPSIAAIPVVAVSAMAMPSDIEAGLAAGFAAYLTKPLNVAAVLGIVHETLARKAGRSA